MKRIVLTGGGTAGHVTPNLALIPRLLEDEWEVHYIGTANGIESRLVSECNDVKYYPIQSGKLRRYIDIKNFSDPFKVIWGIVQSAALVRKIRPLCIFSKGGFVSVPVVIGGWLNKIPVVIHESDYTPGLANRIAARFAAQICTAFPETVNMFAGGKGVYTGTPIREQLFRGSAEKARSMCGFEPDKPVLMVMGGSLGATAINRCIRSLVKKLVGRFNIVHICGKGNVDEGIKNISGYVQFEYLNDEMADVMAIADIIVSRAGSNSIHEFLALKKPSLLIPLPAETSRGDQVDNAASFERKGYCKVLQQEKMKADTLYLAILDVYSDREKYIEAMSAQESAQGLENVRNVIKNCISNAWRDTE